MKSWLAVPLLILLLVVLVLLSPVWIPLLILMDCREKWRLRMAANACECPRCGKLLGKASLKLANRKTSEYVR